MKILDYFYSRKDNSKKLVQKELRRRGLKEEEVESAFVDYYGKVFLKLKENPSGVE